MNEFETITVRTARTPHHCRECRQTIHPGTAYEYSAGKGEDGFWTCHLCLPCRDVWAVLWKQRDRFWMHLGDGIPVGWLREHLLELDVLQRDDDDRISLDPQYSDALVFAPDRPHLPVMAAPEVQG